MVYNLQCEIWNNLDKLKIHNIQIIIYKYINIFYFGRNFQCTCSFTNVTSFQGKAFCGVCIKEKADSRIVSWDRPQPPVRLWVWRYMWGG